MRFTVIWSPIAEGQLLDLWSNHPDIRSDLTNASGEIDSLLRDDPLAKGRPFGVLRTLIEDPVIVLYSVDEGDRKVRILMVRLI